MLPGCLLTFPPLPHKTSASFGLFSQSPSTCCNFCCRVTFCKDLSIFSQTIFFKGFVFFTGSDVMAGGTNDVVVWLIPSTLMFERDMLAATNASAASCSKRVAANRRQSVAFIFLFRNPMGRLSRRLTGVLLCDDPTVGEKLTSTFDGILRFVPVAVMTGGGDRFSMLCVVIVDGDIVDCEALIGWTILLLPVYVPTTSVVSLVVPVRDDGGKVDFNKSLEEEIVEVYGAWCTTSVSFLPLLLEFVASRMEIFVDEEDNGTVLSGVVIAVVTWSRSQLSRGVITDD